MVFRTIGILLRFLRFFTFFENPKSRDFLRFFAVLRTFSRTMSHTALYLYTVRLKRMHPFEFFE